MDAMDSFYFALTTPVVMLLLGACTLIGCKWQKSTTALLWMGRAFMVAASAYAGQALLPSVWHVSAWAPLLALLHFGATFCLIQAVCARFHVRYHVPVAAMLCVYMLGAVGYYAHVEDNMPARTMAVGWALGLSASLPVPALLRLGALHWLEKTLRTCYISFAAFLLLRPLVLLGQWGLHEVLPVRHGLFWWITSFGVMVFGILFAASLMACLVYDTVLVLRTERSQDPLTGLLNRRAFAEAAQQLLRPGMHLTTAPSALGTVVMCDLDYFKRINDQFGHPTGDVVLQRFAMLLREGVREGDVVARFGGEEFVLLLRGVQEAAAVPIVERILARLRAQSFAHSSHMFRVTASFGLAQWHVAEPLEACLQHADQSLYRAKQAGRDQIFCYAKGMPTAPDEVRQAPSLAPAHMASATHTTDSAVQTAPAPAEASTAL